MAGKVLHENTSRNFMMKKQNDSTLNDRVLFMLAHRTAAQTSRNFQWTNATTSPVSSAVRGKNLPRSCTLKATELSLKQLGVTIHDKQDDKGNHLVTWTEYANQERKYKVDGSARARFLADDAIQILEEKELPDGTFEVIVRDADGEQIHITPHTFNFGMGENYAPVMGDKDFEVMMSRIAKNTGTTLAEAKQIVNGAVKLKNRNKLICLRSTRKTTSTTLTAREFVMPN